VSARAAAGYDALYVCDALSRFAGGAAAVELHLFAYLACLISVYDGRGPQEWQYEFVSTPAGAPYAETLAQESDRLRAAGRLLDSGPLLMLSSVGRDDLDAFRQFGSNRARRPHLNAACSAATLLPLPTVAYAITQEPGLRHALSARAPRTLLGDAELLLVDEQFRAVAGALVDQGGEHHDLLVPTSLWLSYLDASSRAAA
jgi:hypothetical protein